MGRLKRRATRFLIRALLTLIALPFVAFFQLLRFSVRRLTGKTLNADGYVVQKSRLGGSELEHRAVAEAYLGRRLRRWEVVHHINGKRSDNHPSNLCVMSRQAHDRYHEWYDWVRRTHNRFPRRETQLKKLREVFHGQILSEPIRKSRVG